MPPKPQLRGPDLEEHYELVEEIGQLLSGDRALRETEEIIRVYQIPDREAMRARPGLREKEYGYIAWDQSGYFERDTQREILPSGDAHDRLDFVSSIRHTVENKKRKLAIQANKKHNRSAATAGGRLGNMLGLYDDLLSQIEHEHYRQQRMLEG